LTPRHSRYSVTMYDSISLAITSRTCWLLTKRQSTAWSLLEFCSHHHAFFCVCVVFWCQDLSDEPLGFP
jgi:hypothetical protein